MIYLYNPDSGAPIKNWWDGHNYWNLAIGEVAGFPEATAGLLKKTYGFLVEVSVEEFEARLERLEKHVPLKVKVGDEGGLVPKSEDEIEEEKTKLEEEKKTIKKAKEKVMAAKEAEPATPDLWELSRGDLINECNRRNIEVKGLGKKGIRVTKEQLINLLENE